MPPATPPFSHDGSLHDLSTYLGRCQHFFDMVDPRNSFLSDAEVSNARAQLDSHKAGRMPAGTLSDAQLWDLKKSALRASFPRLADGLSCSTSLSSPSLSLSYPFPSSRGAVCRAP
jgi:Sideroflexins